MNRGTEAVWPSEGGFTLLCDCGTTTQVIVDLATPSGAPAAAVANQELAITCDGCGSSHWLTVKGNGPQ